jgi:hypothetical protein
MDLKLIRFFLERRGQKSYNLTIKKHIEFANFKLNLGQSGFNAKFSIYTGVAQMNCKLQVI